MKSSVRDKKIPLGFGGFYASPGDHIGHFYRSREESRALVGGFLTAGQLAGEKSVYLGPREEWAPLQELLRTAGVDVDRARASGDLVLHEGFSHPEELKELLRLSLDQVPAQYPLLRWAGEMTWSLRKVPTTANLMEWESHCNGIGDPKPVFLCQYDLTAFQGNVVMDALSTHPVCIVSNVVHHNPYYQEPERFLEGLQHRVAAPLTV